MTYKMMTEVLSIQMIRLIFVRTLPQDENLSDFKWASKQSRPPLTQWVEMASPVPLLFENSGIVLTSDRLHRVLRIVIISLVLLY